MVLCGFVGLCVGHCIVSCHRGVWPAEVVDVHPMGCRTDLALLSVCDVARYDPHRGCVPCNQKMRTALADLTSAMRARALSAACTSPTQNR